MHPLSWESMIAAPPCPSSVSRRLSREFRLGWNVRNKEDREATNREDTHGHGCTEIESNHDEGGRGVYERISILSILCSGTRSQYLIKTGSKCEQYQCDARNSKYSA